MKRVLMALAVALLGVAPAQAALIDFESVAQGTYTSLPLGDVTITFVTGTGQFGVTTGPTDLPVVSGNALLSFFTNPGDGRFRADFSSPVNLVQIGVSDFVPSDDDEPHLEAYSASNVLLDSDTALIGGSGPGVFLSVSSATDIAYVLFYETGSFAGAVYWDNLSFQIRETDGGPQDTPVPAPAPLILLGLGVGLLGLGRMRRG